MTAGAAGAVPRCVGGIAGALCKSVAGAVALVMVWWSSVEAMVVMAVLVAGSVRVWAWVSMVGGGR